MYPLSACSSLAMFLTNVDTPLAVVQGRCLPCDAIACGLGWYRSMCQYDQTDGLCRVLAPSCVLVCIICLRRACGRRKLPRYYGEKSSPLLACSAPQKCPYELPQFAEWETKQPNCTWVCQEGYEKSDMWVYMRTTVLRSDRCVDLKFLLLTSNFSSPSPCRTLSFALSLVRCQTWFGGFGIARVHGEVRHRQGFCAYGTSPYR
jgi:hypothetical protein